MKESLALYVFCAPILWCMIMTQFDFLEFTEFPELPRTLLDKGLIDIFHVKRRRCVGGGEWSFRVSSQRICLVKYVCYDMQVCQACNPPRLQLPHLHHQHRPSDFRPPCFSRHRRRWLSTSLQATDFRSRSCGCRTPRWRCYLPLYSSPRSSTFTVRTDTSTKSAGRQTETETPTKPEVRRSRVTWHSATIRRRRRVSPL